MQNLIQEILKENNKAFLPRLNETQPVEVLFDFELITIREVVSLHTPIKKKNCDVKTDYYRGIHTIVEKPKPKQWLQSLAITSESKSPFSAYEPMKFTE